MPTTAVPPILTTLVGRLAAAVPRRARTTFTELLIGAATTRGGHVTDAILAAGLSRSWTSYYWFLQRGRWAWLAVWRALLAALRTLFEPPVWQRHRGRAALRPGPRLAPAPQPQRQAEPVAVPARPGLAVPGRGGRAGMAGRGGAADAAPGPARHQPRQARERALPRAPARAAAGPGAAPARRLVHARPADRGRARRRPHRDRASAPRPGAVRGPAAASAAASRTAAQVRPADDAGAGRGAAGAPQRAGPLRPVRGRAVPELPGGGPLPEGPGGARGVGAAGTARPAGRGAPAGLHRPGPARDRGHHQLRETVGGGAVVRGHEARLGAQGRLAAVAPGADALGDDPGRRLRARPDAGLRRSGARPGPGRSRPLATARHPHRRADPGGPGAAFARGRPGRSHARDRAKTGPATRPSHRAVATRRCRGRLSRRPGRQHARHATAGLARP